MPPKSKSSSKAPNPEPKASPEPRPETVSELSKLRFYQTNPAEKRREEVGLQGLTPAERKTYTHTNLILPVAQNRVALSNRTERDFWKHVTKERLPIRRLRGDYGWGTDRGGRDLGTYGFEDFELRRLKQASLTALDILHRQFLTKRDVARRQGTTIADKDIEEEKVTRRSMAAMKKDLYGEIIGPLAQNPAWDDVIPIPQNEAEDALAQIAYPDEYAEAVSYLRAVMVAEETSPRCLRLTEHVISMNPAHYTVWLYRFKIISALDQSIPDEIEWLNMVALANLKNYQIWHHRQLLMDHYYSQIAGDAAAIAALGRSETQFVARILEEDTKNYHVWSYRQYLVEKLSLWGVRELAATQNMIEDDVRNNSAWSHRFFLVFSDPSQSSPGSVPTAHDPVVPAAVIDRELRYAEEKIHLAPQNQSPWNYLRGVLVKGGRPLADEGGFAGEFVSGLGKGEGEEVVRSSHALDFLADVKKETGDVEGAKLCLRRLGEKWDPIREGYWKYRVAGLEGAA